IVKKVKYYYSIPNDKKVILFAPTFRDWDANSFQKTYNDIRLLSKQVDSDTIILLRLHYLLSNKMSKMVLPENVINASEYEDIQELYLISDVLITDYSSVMFDYALLGRPMIFYCYDLEEYYYRRGVYFNFKNDAPGPICKDINKVGEFINHPEKLDAYKVALHDFNNRFGKFEDGNATERVIKKVFD